MKRARHIIAVGIAAAFAPAAASAADLDYGYEYRNSHSAYGYHDSRDDYDDYDEEVAVVERRGPSRERYIEPRYVEPVDIYDDPPAPPVYYTRPYRRPYLREFSWYDRPYFGRPYRWRHPRGHGAYHAGYRW